MLLIAVTGKMLLLIIASAIFNLFISIGASCEIPVSPEHGTLRLVLEDSLALYLCDDGRKLVGASASKCLITGQWTSPPPKCVSPCVYAAVSNGSISYPLRKRGFYRFQTQLNAFPVGKTFEHGETAIFRCNDGFTPVGSSQSTKGTEPSDVVVTCDDGQWSPSLNCKPGDCIVPQILNGQIKEQIVGPSEYNWWKVRWERKLTYRKIEVGSIPPHNATVFLVCEDQYSIQGTGAPSGIIECSEGRWTRDPVCHRTVTCPQHVITEDFTVKYTKDRIVNSSATFNCTASLVLLGQSTLWCLQTGKWDHLQPKCQNSSICGPPLKVEGTLTPNLDDPQPGIGTVVTYRCLFGYVNHDSKGVRSVCMWDEDSSRAKWTKPNVGCVRDCTVPRILNGQILEQIVGPSEYSWWQVRWERKVTYRKIEVGSIPPHNATLYLVCEDQYSIQGTGASSGIIECSEGSWTPDPVCRKTVTCPQHVITEEFTVKYTKDRRVNSSATFNCTAPLVLLGQSTLLCLQTGKWDHLQPKCQNSSVCGPPLKVERTLTPNLDDPQPGIGTVVTYRCLFGYENHDSKGVRSVCVWDEDSSRAKWTKPNVGCVPRSCREPGFVPNAHRIGNLFNLFDKVEFQCQKGYKLNGSSVMHCLPSGEWSERLPTCEPVICPQLEKTESITIKYSNGRRVNSTATFNCTAPLVLIGQSTLRCLQTGKWNYLQAICRTPGCRIGDFTQTAPRNVLPSLEDVTGELQPVGSELPMLCKKGWVLAKGKKATCGPLGTWNFGKAQCVVGCHLNVEEKQSKLIIKPIKKFYRFGESVIVSCPVDFQLTSDVERVVCVGSEWSDTMPDCQKIPD